MKNYIFTSKRLGFRNWTFNDTEALFEINNDDDVMEFFPFKPSKQNTLDFIHRMQEMQKQKGFCYFAVDILESNEFIGFIGLCEQTYLDELENFVDVGCRLKKSSWGKGYATEGTLACLDFGFNKVGLKKIYSVAPEINKKSEHVMKKVGMQRIKTFEHPKLNDYKDLLSCVLYEKLRTS
ncbi:GNAT family N-acetyltransferase [Aquimarina sp. 2304DJ70-9]|uniref:GNAT family N-acetyltransferase n=1 Tax=Aquimarina penaris TaxID=3231044 RepID=UPI00346338AA